MTPRKKVEPAEAVTDVASGAAAEKAEADAKKAAPKKAAPKKRTVKKSAPDVPLADLPDADDEQETATGLEDKMVAFFLGEQRYAFPIASVQEIQQIVEFSEVPIQGSSVVGMVNLRGTVIPALDMRTLIGLPAREYELETPMIICRADDQVVAMIVDEVEDVLSIPEGCIQEAPRMHALANRMIGVCRMDVGLVYLLAVEQIIAPVDLPT